MGTFETLKLLGLLTHKRSGGNMIKLILITIACMASATFAFPMTEIKRTEKTVVGTSYTERVIATFDLSDKELINDWVSVSRLDSATGLSFANDSYCVGSTPWGPVLCAQSTRLLSTSIRGYTLTVEYEIALSANPYAHAYVLDYAVMITFEKNSVFSSRTQNITLNLPETQWADIHLSINGQLFNYRMNKEADEFSKNINGLISEGDVVYYWLTALDSRGIIYTTIENSFVVLELPEFLSVDLRSYSMSVSTLHSVDWIIAHYSINNVAYQNVQMIGSSTGWSTPISEGLESGDVVRVFFTYFHNGAATDSDVVEYMQ